MKKIIVAVLLAFTFQASAACETNMLEAYKNGLERAKEKAEINVKIAELKLEVEKIKLQLLLNQSTIKEMEKK